MRHVLASGFQEQRVKVDLIGCGGTGTQLLTSLARLHAALIALGHPGGLDVTVWDPDTVSTSNIGRQLFSPADVGQYKASVLVHRLNCWFGLDWKAEPCRYQMSGTRRTGGIVITCVDTAAARREVWSMSKQWNYPNANRYWLDCGNSEQTGQVFLTCLHSISGMPRKGTDLPFLIEVLPELFDASIPESNVPSCSLAEALENQNLVINQAVATFALNLLWNLFRDGGVETFGAWINLATGQVLPVTLAGWYGRQATQKRCKKGDTNG